MLLYQTRFDCFSLSESASLPLPLSLLFVRVCTIFCATSVVICLALPEAESYFPLTHPRHFASPTHSFLQKNHREREREQEETR
mmetsp:Transcript_31554/g.62413  ORF Transcript_31554/g.62413 Transcript_31554/m.62413 type:complete len:84 (-) Transcript_31554:389-640(-)